MRWIDLSFWLVWQFRSIGVKAEVFVIVFKVVICRYAQLRVTFQARRMVVGGWWLGMAIQRFIQFSVMLIFAILTAASRCHCRLQYGTPCWYNSACCVVSLFLKWFPNSVIYALIHDPHSTALRMRKFSTWLMMRLNPIVMRETVCNMLPRRCPLPRALQVSLCASWNA